jgi:hypothetical protein
MENFNFKEGDIVALKSNNYIPMTIQEIDFEEETAFCIWLDEKGTLQKYRFSFSVLGEYIKPTPKL